MPDLETRIAEWRARMMEALPHRDEAVTELEEHLREQLASLQEQGKSEDEAFEVAQERLGEPHAVAREFDRMPVGWRPGLILLPVLALLLATILGLSLWNWSRRLPLTPLQVVSLVIYVAGYFGVMGSGLIATSAFLTMWRRPLRERERCAIRRLLVRLTRWAVVLLPIGIALSVLWQVQFIPKPWTLWSYNLRLTGSIASVALLSFANSRASVGDPVRWLTAILASLVLFFSGLGTRIRVADVPVAWLCVAFLAAQIFLTLPRFRISRVRESN